MVQLSILKRFIIISFLLIVLYSLCVYYNENYESYADYPSVKTILSHYPDGKNVSVTGAVSVTGNEAFYLTENYHGQYVTYKIYSQENVNKGDFVSVVGILGPSYNIKASKVLVAKKWKEEFVLTRSAIAGLFLLLLFWRYWKFDFKLMEFIRRR
jgi:hypothetical protein